MRTFLIRVVQVAALAMIGACFIAATSHARTSKQQLAAFCSQVGGEFIDDERAGTYSCLWNPPGDGNNSGVSCRQDGTCYQSVCGRGGCAHVYDKDYSGKKANGPKPSKRDGIETAGTADDRGLGGKRPPGTVSGNATEAALGSPKPAPSKTNINTASNASMALSKTNTKPVLSNTAKPPLLWGGSAFGTRAGQATPSAARPAQ